MDALDTGILRYSFLKVFMQIEMKFTLKYFLSGDFVRVGEFRNAIEFSEVHYLKDFDVEAVTSYKDEASFTQCVNRSYLVFIEMVNNLSDE